MSVLQYYYAWLVHPQTSMAGFQVKAMSPGISPFTRTLIARLIAYQIPTTLDKQDIQSHPVVLRYYYENPQEGILLCNQSCGSDENRRPGLDIYHFHLSRISARMIIISGISPEPGQFELEELAFQETEVYHYHRYQDK